MTVLLRLSAGLIVWAAGFCSIYALHGVGCANDWPERTIAGLSLHRSTLIGAWISILILAITIAVRLSRRPTSVLDRASIVTSWSGAAATAITFVPILFIDQCR